MKIEKITCHDDASGWTAIVGLRGCLWVAAYANHHLDVRKAPYKHPPHVPAWCKEAVRKWAADRLAELSKEWHEKHAAMYPETAVTTRRSA